MLTAKDLMVGDWVEYVYKYEHDDGIGRIGINIHNLNDYELYGILIDTNILEKNQFYHRYRRGNEPNYWGGINDTIKIEEHNYNKFKVYIDTYDEDGDLNYIVCSCKYVHELQHIFKILNIDKEIVL